MSVSGRFLLRPWGSARALVAQAIVKYVGKAARTTVANLAVNLFNGARHIITLHFILTKIMF
jgi:hypothetical protein